MPAIEADGFEIIMTVHDEDITEAPDLPEYTVDRLCAHMANTPHWAEGLPLSSAGFEGPRYRKD
jgi:DNA polymerase